MKGLKKGMKDFQQRIEDLMKECIDDMASIGVEISPDIIGVKINKRAKQRLGCCREIRKPWGKEYVIEISHMLKDDKDKLIKDIIYHELLHTVPGCMNHGEKWKKLAKRTKLYLGADVKSRTDYFKENRKLAENLYKYVIKCEGCGRETYRMRNCDLTKNIKDYRCGKCGGKLKVVK